MFNKKIDVFDANFNQVTVFPFIDTDITHPIPGNFAPTHITRIGCHLYVAYGKPNPMIPMDFLDGPGNGYISIFNFDGTFVKRFTSEGHLNTPFGIAVIPDECMWDLPKNGFLVSNTGDGRINAFDCHGHFHGSLKNPGGIPLSFNNLKSLYLHNIKCIPPHRSEIFFVAGINEQFDGLLGSIEKYQ